jgi:branched-chain amino acid transport system substrate-binding protein
MKQRGVRSRIETLSRWTAVGALCAFSVAAGATEYTIAVVQSKTGPAAFIGEGAANAMVLAADEINKKQELGPGNTLNVIVADDATDKNQTLQLINRFGADPKVLIILGPTSGAVAIGASAAANDLKIPMITNAPSFEVLKAGPWGFIMAQPATNVIPYIAEYTATKLKAKNCTIIGISDVETYVGMNKAFESEAKSRGVKIGAIESIKGSDSDFSAVATKVAGGSQDCVFVSASAPQSANIIIQLKQAGLDPKTNIVGHVSLSSPQFLQRGGSAVEGVVFISDWAPGGSNDMGRAFNAAYKAKYGTDPDNWAAVGYGGMRVVAAAIKAAQPNVTRETLRAALTKTKDIPVVVGQGKFSYDEQRITHTGMNVLVVKNGQFVMAP